MHRSTVLAALVLVAALPAQKVGAEAPELVFDGAYGFGDYPAAKLSDLRGSVVLLEVWGLFWDQSMKRFTQLDELYAKKGEQGLVVIGITREEIDDVEPFLQKHKPNHPIVVAQSDDYDLRTVPQSYLIDKDGKVLWTGHAVQLDMAKLDAALVGAKARVVAKGFEDVAELRRKGEHGAAWQKAKELLGKGGLSALATAQANELVAAAETFVAEAMVAADAPEAAKDFYLLWSKLEPVALRYQGVPGADAAVPRYQALMANAKAKKDIEAGQKLTEAAALEAKLHFDAAYDLYKEVASRFGSSRAGRIGNDAYRRLEKEGKLGYDPKCSYCKTKGGACPQHLKKKR